MFDKRRFAVYHHGDPSVGIQGDDAIVEVSDFYFSKENDPDGEHLAWFTSELKTLFVELFDFETHIEELDATPKPAWFEPQG